MYFHIILIMIIVLLLLSIVPYRHISRKSIWQCLLDYLNNRLLTVLIAMIAIEVIYSILHDVKSLFDFSILTAFIVSSLIGIISSIFTRILKNYIEDIIKLSTDYKGLIKKYKGSEKLFLDIERDDKIPVIVDYTWHDFQQIQISKDCSGKNYILPDEIDQYKEKLFQAHDTSNIYNQLNIRVDSWQVKDSVLLLDTSRTSYYSSLMTNRVMDYLLDNGFTVRDLLQPGPFIPNLAESRLSNHIGFNGFIISLDGYIPFVKRNNIVSIGKNTYGTSVSASLKTMYALEYYSAALKKEGIFRGIKNEIHDELKIDTASISYIKVLAAYRDIVEGNKPQFLILAKVNRTRDEIINDFTTAIKTKNRGKSHLTKEESEQEDGNNLIWFTEETFKSLV